MDRISPAPMGISLETFQAQHFIPAPVGISLYRVNRPPNRVVGQFEPSEPEFGFLHVVEGTVHGMH
jgi:hypothetical protein